jgi:hypothetical protein
LERGFFVVSAISRSFISAEEVQENVWYGRRVLAGHVKEGELEGAGKSLPFSVGTVAKADLAFQALYGRPPAPHEWTTFYLFLLLQINRDPTSYDSQIARNDVDRLAFAPRFSPHAVSLQGVVRSKFTAKSTASTMLMSIALVVIMCGAMIVTGVDAIPLPLVGAMLGFIALSTLAGPMKANATQTVYVCPECGKDYPHSEFERCQRCLLEFDGGTHYFQSSLSSRRIPRQQTPGGRF